MNKREVFKWLDEQGCEIKPKEMLNNTRPPVEVVNKKTGRFSYFAVPIHSDEIARIAIEKLIRDLGISPPENF